MGSTRSLPHPLQHLIIGVAWVAVMVASQVVPKEEATMTSPNGSCLTERGEAGTCQRLSGCPKVRALPLKPVCRQSPTDRFVCCPLSDSLNKPRRSGSLRNRRSTIYPCGFSDAFHKKIVGGVESTPGAWPWHVGLMYQGSLELRYRCGATLIARRWVLTAAHCVERDTPTIARCGAHNISNAADPRVRDYRIIDIKIHPLYFKDMAGLLQNDIALIKLDLKSPFPEIDLRDTFPDHIAPACLPRSQEFQSGQHVGTKPFVVGWGTTESSGRESEVLLEAQVRLDSNEECQRKIKAFTSTRKIDITPVILCAGGQGRDSCQGDSGGGLFLPSQNGFLYTQIGIVSGGFGCGVQGVPGFYTRVSEFMDWIDGYLRDESATDTKGPIFRDTTVETGVIVVYKKSIKTIGITLQNGDSIVTKWKQLVPSLGAFSMALDLRDNKRLLPSKFGYINRAEYQAHVAQMSAPDNWIQAQGILWPFKEPTSFYLVVTCSDTSGMRWSIRDASLISTVWSANVQHIPGQTCQNISDIEGHTDNKAFMRLEQVEIWRGQLAHLKGKLPPGVLFQEFPAETADIRYYKKNLGAAGITLQDGDTLKTQWEQLTANLSELDMGMELWDKKRQIPSKVGYQHQKIHIIQMSSPGVWVQNQEMLWPFSKSTTFSIDVTCSDASGFTWSLKDSLTRTIWTAKVKHIPGQACRDVSDIEAFSNIKNRARVTQVQLVRG